MPPIERDAPNEAHKPLRHQHSHSSDHGRALIPMWDSSDPERAPPPLPLNPQSPSVSPSRAGTSSAIQSAHAALTEKARESQLLPTALLHKRSGETSPERSLVKNSVAHRRMQSVQPSSVRDLGFVLEGGGRDSLCSTPRSPEKSSGPGTPVPLRSSARDPFVTDAKFEDKDKDFKDDRHLSLTLSPGSTFTPIIRPIARRTTQSILGENTPPQSATMLALQNMSTPTRETPSRETPAAKEPAAAPLSDVITNGPASALVRTPGQSTAAFDSLSKQILSLTSIATSLQKEMSQLSRRSRDNATDLLSLKEATNTRDEDIRKSLRELITKNALHERASTRDPYGASLLLDNRPHSHVGSDRGGGGHTSPLSSAKVRPFSLPRIPSPNSFSASLDGSDRMSTPSLYGSDGPATIALLEKIVRDMGTKEGQDSLVDRLSEIATKMAGMASATKVEELLRFVKESQEQAIVVAAGGSGGGGRDGPRRPRNFSFDEDPSEEARDLEFGSGAGSMVERLLYDGGGTRRSSAPTPGDGGVVNDDLLKTIRAVKDSVAQGGGLTAEVKALVRELRGEVLGMGREIGRRLDDVSSGTPSKTEAVTKAEIHRVVEEGLDEMKSHINQLLREHRRQSAATLASLGPVVDYKEVYNSMRSALKDSQAARGPREEYSRDDVMRAVKEAWEKYKPDIAVEQIGLERDEVLECLKEGLRQYAPRNDVPQGATREEVFKAVAEGLKHFTPPRIETPASLSRDEVLEAVRECLEEFEFPVAPSALGAEITKQDVVDAVTEGLSSFEIPQPELPLITAPPSNDEVLARLREIMQFLREEFQAVSEEAKQNVAANGRDTEQVLDATKDGFEKLRIDIEGFVERASGAAGQERFLDGLVRTLDVFREEIADLVSSSTEDSRKLLKGEIESLRDTVNSSLVPMSSISNHHGSADNKEVLDALHDGISGLRHDLANRPIAGTNEVLDALQEGLQDLRTSIERLSNKPADLSANDEILDALKEGLDGVRSDIGTMRDANEKAVTLAPVPGPGPVEPVETPRESNAIVPVDILKHDDIKNLEVLIGQLRTKVDAMETPAAAPQPPPTAAAAAAEPTEPAVPPLTKEDVADVASKEDLSDIVEMLQSLQESVEGMSATKTEPLSTDPATREDVVAIETILRNTKARLDEALEDEQVVRKDHIDALEAVVLETKESLGSLKTQLEGLSRLEDIKSCESLIAQVANEFEEMKDRHDKQFDDPERVTKTDVDAIEAVCLDVKTAVDQMIKADLASLPTKDDVAALPSKGDLEKLESLIKALQDRSAADAQATAKAFEERQAETVGVSDDIAEVRKFLEQFQGAVKERLHDGATGIDKVGQVLETLGETMGKNANLSTDLKEMCEMVKLEFEESRAGVVGAKLDSDEKFQQTTDTLSAKVDERIGDLLAKLEEMQLEAEDRAKAGEAREAEAGAAVSGSKAVAEELKTLIDTLGATVTDSLEKMEEASKTVFGRVEDLVGKADENHIDAKVEHQLTRDEVQLAVSAIEGLQGHVADELEPKILEGLKNVLLIVGQHYEHSKSSTESIREKIEETTPQLERLLPPPPEKYDDAHVLEKLDVLSKNFDASAIMAKLESLSESEHGAASEVADKLGKLLEQCEADTATVGEKLDKVVEQSSADAASVGEKVDKLAEQSTVDTACVGDKIDKFVDQYGVDTTAVGEKLDKLVEQSSADAASVGDKIEKLSGKCDEDNLVVHDKLDNITDKFEESTGGVNTKLDYITEKVDENGTGLNTKLDHITEKVDEGTGGINTKLDRITEKVDESTLDFTARFDRITEKVDETTGDVTARLDGITEKVTVGTGDVTAKLDHITEKVTDGTGDMTAKLDLITGKVTAGTGDVTARLDKISEKVDCNAGDVSAQLAQISENVDARAGDVGGKLDTISEKVDGRAGDVSVKLDQISEKVDDRVGDVSGKLDQVSLIVDDRAGEMTGKLDKISEKVDDRAGDVSGKLDKISEKVDDRAGDVGVKLDKISERLEDPAPAAAVHEKLDRLVSDSQDGSEKALAQLDTLDKVHRQVVQTAAEVSQFLAAQKQRIADDNEDRERTLQETNKAIERAEAAREHLDASVAQLREEEERLKRSVAELRTESEALEKRRTRLAADVSSLETAAHMRREELREVEDRAQALERRVLEGIMDQSRVLLMASRASATGTGLGRNKGREAMSRKRVASPSHRAKDAVTSAATSAAAAPAPAPAKPRSAAINSMTMAAASAGGARGGIGGGRTSNAGGLAPPTNSPAGGAAAGRRIVSLSQINHNVPAGGFKRSQSVRQPAGRSGLRKSSWAGATPVPASPAAVPSVPPVPAVGTKGYGDLDPEDKENAPLPPPGDEDGERSGASTPRPSPRERQPMPPASDGGGDDGHEENAHSSADETDTLRRSSLGTTVITEQSSARGTYDGSDDEEGEGDEYHSDDGTRSSGDEDDDGDLTSEAWTESQVGSSVAPSEGIGSEVGVGGGEMVLGH